MFKNFFYLTLSVLLVWSFLEVREYFQKIEAERVAKRANLDAYYIERLYRVLLLQPVDFEEKKQNILELALLDGYDRAEAKDLLFMAEEKLSETLKEWSKFEKAPTPNHS